MSEPQAAIDRLRIELKELGVTGVHEVGDDGILSVWIGLVIRFRDGFYRWQEGQVKRRHLGTDPGGCAVRVARRYTELQGDVPSWWEDLAKILRGDAAEDYP
ncbi:hypothetical protein OHA77_28330 [Streptosporangium sp. NBC_01639]|uniref:hypothetical protein n=1 Tax=unclassified Streptosporangium TaxID=2632669 RepID=UPI002DD94488|nr:hypothetical protein [Streptosporangium sp. NBC_01756]WSC88760.1 hypothetical protein OIE48_11400 [Streptosporangium sp. NBC_01756]WTD52551.1 hypothetical protein OHA77_28330 [Streptosporangium sp. NBC_01639]